MKKASGARSTVENTFGLSARDGRAKMRRAAS